jgi:hypothetical protein
MKTEELIRVLAADGSRSVVPIDQALLRALGLGAVASIALFLMLLHPRPDLAQALFSLPFVFKLAFALLVATAASLFLIEAARPLAPHRWRWALALAPLLLTVGVVVELASTPTEAWVGRLIGRNAPHCLALIPLLSLPPLIALFAVLRHGAPLHPMLAGATAGLVAGGVGSFLYALVCPDDSPLFIATWYSIAIAIVTSAAAYVGGRLLRW